MLPAAVAAASVNTRPTKLMNGSPLAALVPLASECVPPELMK